MSSRRHVFISHSSKDRALAEEVDALLRSWSIDTWMAPRDIGSGGTFAGQITKAVDRCSALIVIVTPAAYKSKFVHVEVERAFQKKKALYPVRFNPVKPSGDIELYLSAYQWVDAFEPDREEALERLAYDLGGRPVQGESSAPPAPEEAEPVPVAIAAPPPSPPPAPAPPSLPPPSPVPEIAVAAPEPPAVSVVETASTASKPEPQDTSLKLADYGVIIALMIPVLIAAIMALQPEPTYVTNITNTTDVVPVDTIDTDMLPSTNIDAALPSYNSH